MQVRAPDGPGSSGLGRALLAAQGAVGVGIAWIGLALPLSSPYRAFGLLINARASCCGACCGGLGVGSSIADAAALGAFRMEIDGVLLAFAT